MSTTAVTAGQIMDRVANLLNDPKKTDYTYLVQLPYLNMAIEEFSDLASEANTPFSNLTNTNWTGTPLILSPGISKISPPEYDVPGTNYHFPPDLIEIQEVGERAPTGLFNNNPLNAGPPFRALPRREFQVTLPVTNSLLYWVWENGFIRFNPGGANTPLEIQIKYIQQAVSYAANENSLITVIGARTYLGYKTAALCALFIGENESRAKVLEDYAEDALERTLNISNKGRQQIMTRHRPFRAAYKARGY